MTSRIVTICLCICLSLALIGCAKGPTKGPKRLKVGDTAPPFVLTSIWGAEEFNASRTFQDNTATVIIIWSMACPTCREGLAECERVYEQYGAKGIAFCGINFDTENIQGVKTFLKGEGIRFTNLWDPRSRVTRSYRALDYTFSIFVVGRGANLVLVQYDHPPDLATILSETLDRMMADEFKGKTK